MDKINKNDGDHYSCGRTENSIEWQPLGGNEIGRTIMLKLRDNYQGISQPESRKRSMTYRKYSKAQEKS